MRIRKVCVRTGHQWTTWGPPMPFQFCSRAFCQGERVNPGFPMPDDLRAALEREVLRHMVNDL